MVLNNKLYIYIIYSINSPSSLSNSDEKIFFKSKSISSFKLTRASINADCNSIFIYIYSKIQYKLNIICTIH